MYERNLKSEVGRLIYEEFNSYFLKSNSQKIYLDY